MAEHHEKMLSAHRGNRLGIGFFRWFIAVFGVRHACNFVWFVALFYALFDREARRRTGGYMDRRFPGVAGGRRWFHIYKLLASQGEALVIAGCLARRPWQKMRWVEENRTAMADALSREQGLVIVTSHFGCWQAAMAGLAGFGRRINLLGAPDANVRIRKQLALDGENTQFREIDATGFMGGLSECLAALAAGEVVCMMGDRMGGAGKAGGLETDFLNRPSMFPVSPYWVAARARVPVIPMFVACERHPFQLRLVFGDPIEPADVAGARLDAERLRPPLEQYVRTLEGLARRYPYEVFRFED